MEKDIFQKLKEVISFPSVLAKPEEGAPFGRPIKECLEYVIELSKSFGLKTKIVDDVVGYAEYGNGDEMIAVLTHLDVVPAGCGWNTPPFELVEQDGKFYGRGIMDDKGPAIMCLFALKKIIESGETLNKRIRIIFGTDEESGCRDMDRYVKTEEMPSMAFTPDADFPVIFSEKNLAVFQISIPLDEVSKGKTILFADAGDVVNKVPKNAEIVFEDGQKFFTDEGITAHGSRPDLGKNAIDILIKQIIKSDIIKEVKPEIRNFFEFYMNYMVDDIYGTNLGAKRVCPDTGVTSFNPGLLKIIDKNGRRLALSVDLRIPATYNQSDILDDIKKICKKENIDFAIDHTKEGIYVSKSSELIRKLLTVYNEVAGRNETPIAIGGGTYAKKLPNTVAFGPLFPWRNDTIHQANECILVEDFELCMKIYQRAMLDMAK